MKKIKYLLLGLVFTLFITCKKSIFNTSVTIRLTDDPGPYTSVYVDIQKLEIHYSKNDSDASKGWENIPINSGIYDLMKLQNGIDTILASSLEIPAGHITQVRFILGDNNSVVVDSVSYNLNIPSSEKSGIKILLKEKLSSSKKYDILFDFDASKSIIEKGNDEYQLKPVIQVSSVQEI